MAEVIDIIRRIFDAGPGVCPVCGANLWLLTVDSEWEVQIAECENCGNKIEFVDEDEDDD